jgi:bifunctional DNA-binding transcriptional regulator/antitoxin component of YhaV-PrlF toxin-antitoxin module
VPLFTRRLTLPAAIRNRLDLPSGDRVLVAAELADGRWAAAARRSLYVAGAEGEVERRPWSDVDRASLAPETSTITVNWIDGTREELTLADPRAAPFARALRERVQSSVVHSEIVTLPGGGEVRVALRRDENGRLLSQVIGSAGLDLADPYVAARVDAAEARVRSAAGLAV